MTSFKFDLHSASAVWGRGEAEQHSEGAGDVFKRCSSLRLSTTGSRSQCQNNSVDVAPPLDINWHLRPRVSPAKGEHPREGVGGGLASDAARVSLD